MRATIWWICMSPTTTPEIADNQVYEIETMTMANEQFQKDIKFTKVDNTFDMYLDDAAADRFL